MFDRLGTFVTDHPRLVIVFWLSLALVLRLVAPRWDAVTHDGDLAYLPERMPSVEGERLLQTAFPDQKAKSELAIVVERPGAKLSSADLLWSDGLADRFRARSDDLKIVDVWNRNTEVTGDKLTSRISKNGQATVTLLKITNEFMAVGNMALLAEVQQIVDEARASAPDGLNVGITGSAAVGGDMLRAAAESIKNTEMATIFLVVLILLIVYRAPLLVLIPLVTIGVSLVVSIDVLALLTQVGKVPGFEWWNFKIFTTTKIFIIVILFGAGTDFCLFLVARYKEELQRGLDSRTATSQAVTRVGAAIVGSALTTICGLGMMFFADFGKFRNSGPAIAMCLTITLLACLTLAPALLRASGRAVFWPFGIGRRGRAGEERTGEDSDATDDTDASRFWQWTSRVVVRHPGLILVGCVALLSPLAYQGLSLKLTYDFLNELRKSSASVYGTELARKHYPAGEMAPIAVLALQSGGHFDQPEGEREIARLTKKLYDLDGIVSVRSIAEPLGDRPGYFQPFSARGRNKLAALRHKMTKARFQSQVPEFVGDVTRFDLVFEQDPFSPKAIDMLNEVDRYLAGLSADPNSAWHAAKFTYVGTTVGIRDLEMITKSDQILIEQLVVLAVSAVLLVLLRRPLICAYLIVSVLFSYYVTIGLTQLFFQWLYGDTFYGLDWKVPIFLFVILIAVGEDYNIYLMTRVMEEQERHGALEGLRRAVARTGGIITSCGVIMAGTFVSMTTGTLRGVVELGFALSLGVMLDTCIVRPILVPCFLALLERIGLGGSRRAGPPAAEQRVEQPVAQR